MENTRKVERKTYSIKEAAVLLGCCARQANDAARNGQIPTIRIGKRHYIPKAALERMLELATPKF